MDTKFLVDKWDDFEVSENYSNCMGYVRAREKNLPKTNKLIKEFIYSKISVTELKTGIAKLRERELPVRKKQITSIWGADRFKGVVLFTLLIKYSDNAKNELDELGRVLKGCLVVPKDIEEAKTMINLFYEYLKKFSGTITQEKIKNSKYPDKNWIFIKGAINPSFSSAFIPVLWDMQELNLFPIYYTSCERIIHILDEKDKYYKESNSCGENYKLFYDFNLELISKLKERYDREFSFSDVSTDYLNYIKKLLYKPLSR